MVLAVHSNTRTARTVLMSGKMSAYVVPSCFGKKTYPKDDVSKVVSITPSLSERWLGITDAFPRLYIEGSIRIRRVGDGETVVG